MPFTDKQHRLFEWAGRNPAAATAAGYDIKPKTALRMGAEGIKPAPMMRARLAMASGGAAKTNSSDGQQDATQATTESQDTATATAKFELQKLAQQMQVRNLMLAQQMRQEQQEGGDTSIGFAGGGQAMLDAVKRASSMMRHAEPGRNANLMGETLAPNADLNRYLRVPPDTPPGAADRVLGIAPDQQRAYRQRLDEIRRMANDMMPEGYADGGEIKTSPFMDTLRDPSSYRGLGAVGAGLGAALMGVAARKPQAINQMALRLGQRVHAKPWMPVESVASSAHGNSRFPLTQDQSDALYRLAQRHAEPMVTREPQVRQGAWYGDRGFEANPLYATQLEPWPGQIKDHEHALKAAASMGVHLQQDAVPVMRGMPRIMNTPNGADALFVKNAADRDVVDMGRHVGGDKWAVAHMPNKDAMLLDISGGQRDLTDLDAKLKAILPHIRTRFGTSTEGVDRLATTKTDWGAPNRTYDSLNPVGPLGGYRKLEDDILNGNIAFKYPPLKRD